MKEIKLVVDDVIFTIEQESNRNSITSEGLESECFTHEDTATPETCCRNCECFESMVSCLYSTILGHIKAGIDITTDSYKVGIQSALSDINRYADCLKDIKLPEEAKDKIQVQVTK